MLGKSEFQVGIAAIAAAAFLLLIAIPYGVTSPSNVRNVVLAPTFWPQVLSGLLALAGLGLVLTAPGAEPRDDEGLLIEVEGGLRRLALMAGTMVVYVWVIPLLGMVWTSMLAFGAVAALVHTRHPLWATGSAVLIPLLLYGFFAHVAAVAVPQGEFVRLP